MKPQTGIQHESISSDEENDTSLDVSDQSSCEDGSLTDSDETDGEEDTHTDTVPSARSQRHTAQVCALYLLTIMIKNYLWIVPVTLK